jgi:hypothetical protein
MAALEGSSQLPDESYDENEAKHRFEQALRDARLAHQERMNGRTRSREGRVAPARGETARGEPLGAARQGRRT